MEKIIFEYLDKDCIIVGLKQKNKKNILTAILDHLIEKKKINKNDKSKILKLLLQREQMGSTAIGGYIALPHARVDCIKDIVLCFAISKDGLDFNSLDQEPVHIIALLLSNQKEAGLHLKMLASLAKILRDKYFVNQLKEANTEEEVLSLLNKQKRLFQ